MPFFFRDPRRDEVVELVQEFCSLVSQCVTSWHGVVEAYLEDPSSVAAGSRAVFELEGAADRVRFKVERKMFKGAFLPAYREDYIMLLEAIDRVANKCEECAALLDLARPAIPEAIHPAVRAMLAATVEAYAPVPDLVYGVITDTFKTKKSVREISHKEHEVDDHQYQSIRWVFHESGLPLAEKMLLKEVLEDLGGVADRIEDAADRLNLISIKRKLG